MDVANPMIESLNSTGGGESNHYTGSGDLPRRVWTNPRRFIPGARSAHDAIQAADATCQRATHGDLPGLGPGAAGAGPSGATGANLR